MFHYQLKTFDLKINIAGVILNNIGGVRHSRKAREAIETYTGTPVIGEVKRDESMKISMRHLGLIPVMEGRRKLDDFDQRISGIRDIIREGIEIDTLIDIAGGAIPIEKPEPRVFIPRPIAEKPVIGIALDEAFNFYYRDNLDLLEMAGEKLEYFSPVNDAHPGCGRYVYWWGYPELFAPELAANEDMRNDIKEMSRSGLPIFGECGELMYLTQALITGKIRSSSYRSADMPEGEHLMVGALPGKTLMRHTRVVSYSHGSFIEDTPAGNKENMFLGHEFHHSEIIDLPENAKFGIKLTRGTGIKEMYNGLMSGNTLGVYSHLHAVSYREFPIRFVDACLRCAPASPSRIEIRGIPDSWTYRFFHAFFTFIPNVFAYNISRIKEVRQYANFEKSLISLLSAVIHSKRSGVVGEETVLFPYRFSCSILCFCFFLFKVPLYPADSIQVVYCYSNSPTYKRIKEPNDLWRIYEVYSYQHSVNQHIRYQMNSKTPFLLLCHHFHVCFFVFL